MSALQRSRFGVSRRDVGAGLVAGVAALLANVLFHASMVVRIALSDPGAVLSYFEWDILTVLPLVVSPVAAVLVGTAIWRTMLPDDPTPRRGALAGVATAFGSLLGVALAFGLFAGLAALSQGVPSEAVSGFLIITAIVLLFGGVLTASIIAPLGALLGYGYEWYLARQ